LSPEIKLIEGRVMKKNIKRTFTIPAFMACLFWTTCSIDQGIDPQLVVPTIKGKVYFKGEKPENTEWVVVVASRDFPPSDILELSQSQSHFLNLSADSADYEIELSAFGSYAAVGAVWKGRGEQLALSDVLGIYGASLAGGISFPDTVKVTPETPVADSIDFAADFSIVNRGAAIRGRIHYTNAWPDNTEFMAIAAFKTRPQNLLDFLNVSAINISLPFNVDFHDYKLATPPGAYRYIVVLWKAKGTSLFEFKELNFYETEPGSGVPAEVTVAKGDTARGVDIFVNFTGVN
jgi:hypothetical protein